jgi:hypothetical protein
VPRVNRVAGRATGNQVTVTRSFIHGRTSSRKRENERGARRESAIRRRRMESESSVCARVKGRLRRESKRARARGVFWYVPF